MNTTSASSLGSIPDVPNYMNSVPIYATRGNRGGSPVYSIQIPITLALDLFPKPDPNHKFPNQRKISVPHAKEWGKYWEVTPRGWGCPAGLLSVRNDFGTAWEPLAQGNGVSIGILSLPRNLPFESEILDMQHRLYGWHLKRQDLQERIVLAKDLLRAATEQGDKNVIEHHSEEIHKLQATLNRMNDETIAVEIQVLTSDQHRILFGKIAKEAMPINASQIVDFDSSDPLNRVVHSVATHPLLKDRIDMDATNARDTIRRANPNLLGGAALSNITRAIIANHVSGRMTPRREDEVASDEPQYVAKVEEFFDIMCDAFPDLNKVMNGTMTPASLRSNSLLGSPTVLRVLAGAYGSLAADTDSRGKRVKPRMSPVDVGNFFTRLAPFMEIPVTNKGWLDTGNFPPTGPGLPDVNAPSSRNQDLKALATSIENWAQGTVAFPFV
jgi:hypothetical protein